MSGVMAMKGSCGSRERQKATSRPPVTRYIADPRAGSNKRGGPVAGTAPPFTPYKGRSTRSLAGITTTIVFVTVVAAVAVAVVTIIAVVAAKAAVTVGHLAMDTLLEAGNPALDVITVPAAEAVALEIVDAPVEIARFLGKPARFTLRQDVAAVELTDLAADLGSGCRLRRS